MRQKAADLKGGYEDEGAESECREDQDHDLWYRTGPIAELRRVSMCCTGVGSNSIQCSGCKHWVNKKCSELRRLKEDPNFRCPRCLGTARLIDRRPQKAVQVRPDKLEVVASICYFGDMLSAAG